MPTAIAFHTGSTGEDAYSVNTSYGSERMRIDASGNVGISTSGPTAPLTVKARAADNIAVRVLESSNNASIIQFTNDPVSAERGSIIATNTGNMRLGGASTAEFYTAGSERMRVDSSGSLRLGTTSDFGITNKLTISYTGGGTQFGIVMRPGTDNTTPIYFQNSSGALVGSIGTDASNTFFNTSSDYRLKHDVQPLTGGLATIAALKPSIYKWIADESQGEGFIAHELAEHIPHAVTGEKDAVNADGSIKPQGVDYSRVVVHLVAAVQELKAENDALKARITTLETR
jgi:hypothetical protein